jgi:hypothetical protein
MCVYLWFVPHPAVSVTNLWIHGMCVYIYVCMYVYQTKPFFPMLLCRTELCHTLSTTCSVTSKQARNYLGSACSTFKWRYQCAEQTVLRSVALFPIHFPNSRAAKLILELHVAKVVTMSFSNSNAHPHPFPQQYRLFYKRCHRRFQHQWQVQTL